MYPTSLVPIRLAKMVVVLVFLSSAVSALPAEVPRWETRRAVKTDQPPPPQSNPSPSSPPGGLPPHPTVKQYNLEHVQIHESHVDISKLDSSQLKESGLGDLDHLPSNTFVFQWRLAPGQSQPSHPPVVPDNEARDSSWFEFRSSRLGISKASGPSDVLLVLLSVGFNKPLAERLSKDHPDREVVNFIYDHSRCSFQDAVYLQAFVHHGNNQLRIVAAQFDLRTDFLEHAIATALPMDLLSKLVARWEVVDPLYQAQHGQHSSTHG
ncbi:hypothetical protein EV360DRAFT_69042 [Lentinula raphanica]|nr:hypothetical protein EV360DRAFT_69042 [Lentinula raphanica]